MQKSQENNGQFSPPCVDNSVISEENKELFNENSLESPKITENSEKIAENIDKIEENINLSASNTELNSENAEGTAITTLESQIERDFKDFQVIYPNISKNSLISDESLRVFAEGKENKPLSVVYAQYMQFVDKIGQEAIKQEQIRQNNAISSVGGLSSAKSGNDGYFTKEQVLKMSQNEIKRNFKRIRESQARW